MIRFSNRFHLIAAAMAFVAGFVDALGVIHLGHFVSFMSGNSTRLGVSLADRLPDAVVLAALIVLFVAGVTISSMLRLRYDWLDGNHLAFGTAALLACAACLALLGFSRTAILLAPVAMGAMNTVVRRDGGASVGVTYVTGTLVNLGKRLAQALSGGDRWAWFPHFLLWLGLMTGAICGALSYPAMGLQGLWLPAAALMALAVFADLGSGSDTAA